MAPGWACESCYTGRRDCLRGGRGGGQISKTARIIDGRRSPHFSSSIYTGGAVDVDGSNGQVHGCMLHLVMGKVWDGISGGKVLRAHISR